MSRSYRDRNLECKVYIGNLSQSTSKPEVETKFSRYGKLKSTWVARNPPGFAFVEFEDPRDAEDAVRALDGTRICGTRVRVEMSHGRSRKTINKRYYSDSKSRRRRYRSSSRSRSRSYSKRRNDSFSRSRSRSRSRSPLSRSRSRS